MTRIVLNPEFEALRPWVCQIATTDTFMRQGELVYQKRNTVKFMEANGMRVVVKRYGRISFINRFAYRWIRKSKAERAYLYAARLRAMQVDTPTEVAYVEKCGAFRLNDSYFIALYSDFTSVGVALQQATDESHAKSLLQALAGFIKQLHDNGIVHRDLHVSNILYRVEGEKYHFQLIDINEMYFHRSLSLSKRVENLQKLTMSEAQFNYLLCCYARLLHVDEAMLCRMGAEALRQRTRRRARKHRLKALLGIRKRTGDYVAPTV